ncbi:MAG: hypothetical protein A3F70_11325 [Acidobacteria bacterium RIFCSPLOWO2_12_FULL_67_14]|nr:MAG: hypothetical protein A3F70_11325 [Acidobacteria bacterium RIFCSPLOWO2_12_FULL_67_14]
MRSRFLVLATLLAVAAGGAVPSAQDGLRSAALPERAPSAAGPGTDLFAAGPDFYRRPPEPRRDPPLVILPYAWPAPYWYWYSPPPDIYRPPEPRNPKPAARPAEPAAPSIVPPPPPPAPGPAKTFYVIPGCYAGDRRPAPEWLPAGCDISRLRVVPPR